MKDPVTHRSRGFGFVKFDNRDHADKILAKGKDHYVDGKQVNFTIIIYFFTLQ